MTAAFFMLLGLSTSLAQTASIEVAVICYDFPPYHDDQKNTGVTSEFVELLNSHQAEYRFALKPTSAKRRYRDLESGRGDMVLFEMLNWGWQNSGVAVEVSKPILKGGEVYLARNLPGRGQEYFNSLENKKIAAILGYHYGFASFNADQKWLNSHFDIVLGSSLRKNIWLMEEGKVDIAVVPTAFLNGYLQEYPEKRDKILKADRLDQAYHLGAVIRKGSPLDVNDFNQMIDDLNTTGKLHHFFHSRGMADQLPG